VTETTCNTVFTEPAEKTQSTAHYGQNSLTSDEKHLDDEHEPRIIGFCRDCGELKELFEIETFFFVCKKVCRECKEKYSERASRRPRSKMGVMI